MNEKLYNNILKALTDSANDVFKTMISIQIKATQPFSRQGLESLSDITGVISLTGDIMGSVILSMDDQMAQMAVSKMLGDEVSNHQEVIDGVGEIANMVVGMAKTELSNLSCDFEISVPVMIIGKGAKVKHLAEGEGCLTTIPFDTELGSIFHLELYAKEA